MPQWLIRHRWLGTVGVVIALLAVITACSSSNETTPTPSGSGGAPTASGGGGKALKIGALLSFTGDLADFGQPLFNGAQMAVNEINAAGGVLGQQVTLVKADDGTSPQQGVTEAQRLVNIEGVQAIVGALSSGVTLQVAETVTGKAGVVQISPASTSPALTNANDNDFLFRTTISDAAQGILLARLAQDEGLSKVCTMYINNAYGQGLSNAFATNFQQLGGTVTAQVPHESAQTTYASELAKCKGADAMAAIAYPQSAGVFLRESVEQNIVPKYLFVDGTKDDKMIGTLGWQTFDGSRGTSPSSLPPSLQITAFEERYKAAYGTLPPRPYIGETYDAVYLIALAAQKAGSTDPKAIRDALRDVTNPPGQAVNPGTDGFKNAISLLAAGTKVAYEGATGPIGLDSHGDRQIGAIEWWHVDAAHQTLVTDKKFEVDLSTNTVTELVLPSPTPAPSASP